MEDPYQSDLTWFPAKLVETEMACSTDGKFRSLRLLFSRQNSYLCWAKVNQVSGSAFRWIKVIQASPAFRPVQNGKCANGCVLTIRCRIKHHRTSALHLQKKMLESAEICISEQEEGVRKFYFNSVSNWLFQYNKSDTFRYPAKQLETPQKWRTIPPTTVTHAITFT